MATSPPHHPTLKARCQDLQRFAQGGRADLKAVLLAWKANVPTEGSYRVEFYQRVRRSFVLALALLLLGRG